MPKVSVLIPAYNCEEFILEALESINLQTFQDFEVIIVEDCSTDSTYSVVEKYIQDKPKFKLFKNKVNSGVAVTLNKGLEHCVGEYVARMDADDISLPSRLEQQVNFLQTHPKVAGLGTAFTTFGDRSTPTNNIYAHQSNSIELALLFISNARFCHPTVMIRTEIIKQFNGYPVVKAEDFALFSKISHTHLLSNLKTATIKV